MPSMPIKKLTVYKGQRLKGEEGVTSKDYLVDKFLASNKKDMPILRRRKIHMNDPWPQCLICQIFDPNFSEYLHF